MDILQVVNNEPKHSSSKLIIFLMLILVIIVVGIIYWFFRPQTQKLSVEKPALQTQQKYANIQQIDTNNKFYFPPADLPWEDKVEVNQYTFQTVSPTAGQVVREYISKKSLTDNFSIYKKYFTTKGWTVSAPINETDHKSLFSQTDDKQVSISIDFSKNTKGQTVVRLMDTFVALRATASTTATSTLSR
jgi:hypothetical protein